jgi:2-hydroxychromene-2-carboxylate isomerase
MAKMVEFYFDFGSPTAYLAWRQLPQIARRCGAAIEYKPFLLGGVFKATGNQSPVTVAAKAVWMNVDLARWARRYGVPLSFNPYFPINTLALMRGAHAAQGLGCLVPYGDAIYDATWKDGLNVGDETVVRSLLGHAQLDADAILAGAQTDAVKEALKRTTQEAVDRGAFGAPTFFVGGEMFWGQDRLDFVAEALQDEARRA